MFASKLFIFVYFLMFRTLYAQNYSALAINSTECEGVLDFSISNSTLIAKAENSAPSNDFNVMLTMRLLPTWIEEDCKRSMREITCMNGFSEDLEVEFCKSDCEMKFDNCAQFLELILKSGDPNGAILAATCSSFQDSSDCVESGNSIAYEDDEPICPQVFHFPLLFDSFHFFFSPLF